MSTRTKVALAAGLVIVVGILILRHRPGPQINRASYEQIQVGMTQAQVEAILGGPPGDYGARELEAYTHIGSEGQLPEVGRVERWLGTSAFIAVEFDGLGTATAKEL